MNITPGERNAKLNSIVKISDADLIAGWLAARSSSHKSFRVRRKEAERFVIWARQARSKCLQEISTEDANAYAEFLVDPQPLAMWVSKTKYPRSRPEWRPFAGPLGTSSRRLALMELTAMYNWMIDRGFHFQNPFGSAPKPELIKEKFITRQLPEIAIHLMFEVIQLSSNPKKAARDSFMIALFYLTGIRTFEATNANMSDVRSPLPDEHWLQVIGRCKKLRDVPISVQLYNALIRYRIVFGLPSEIPDNDSTPLILAANSKLKRAHDDTVLKAVKQIMGKAAILARDRELYDVAHQLERASTHWLRHSCFSHLATATGNLVLVNSLAGNSSLDSISRYIPIDNQMLLRSMDILTLPSVK
jgi:site-specific recombinase XerD